jgi:hypothetical protein
MLKKLAKEISDDLTPGKAVTPMYRGPVTFRTPTTIKNVQDWHVIPTVLGNTAMACQKNREPPFTEEVISYLESLFEMALELYRNRDEAA